jgi:hypothetical protein
MGKSEFEAQISEIHKVFAESYDIDNNGGLWIKYVRGDGQGKYCQVNVKGIKSVRMLSGGVSGCQTPMCLIIDSIWGLKKTSGVVLLPHQTEL